MSSFNFDLGFDGNAPNSMPYGISNADDNTLTCLTALPDASFSLTLRLFDITPVNTQNAPTVPLQAAIFAMSIVDVDSNISATPLHPSTGYTMPIQVANPQQSTSPVFPSGSALTCYSIGVFDVVDNGHFNLSISITLTKSDGSTLMYILDPEMIVGGSDTGGGDGDSKTPLRTAQPERPAMNL